LVWPASSQNVSATADWPERVPQSAQSGPHLQAEADAPDPPSSQTPLLVQPEPQVSAHVAWAMAFTHLYWSHCFPPHGSGVGAAVGGGTVNSGVGAGV
jgi:hypothetical protein